MNLIFSDMLALTNFLNRNFASVYTEDEAITAYRNGCTDLQNYLTQVKLPLLNESLACLGIPAMAAAMILLDFKDVLYDVTLLREQATTRKLVRILSTDSPESLKIMLISRM